MTTPPTNTPPSGRLPDDDVVVMLDGRPCDREVMVVRDWVGDEPDERECVYIIDYLGTEDRVPQGLPRRKATIRPFIVSPDDNLTDVERELREAREIIKDLSGKLANAGLIDAAAMAADFLSRTTPPERTEAGDCERCNVIPCACHDLPDNPWSPGDD